MIDIAVNPRSQQGRAERTRWALADGWTVARRDLLRLVRARGELVGGLAFPIISVLLFGYVFGNAMTVPGGGDYREFLMPGLFAMTMVFGLTITTVSVVTDNARGIGSRFRSMPMAPSAVVLGRSVADMLRGVLDLTALLLCGLAVGWRANGPWHQALVAIALLLLLRFALIWVGVYLGLVISSPETASGLFALILPFAMVANTFVDPALMPAWLGTIAEWNPMSATVAACRELFGNPGLLGADSWVADNAIMMAALWPLAMIAVFFPLSVRRYRRLSR